MLKKESKLIYIISNYGNKLTMVNDMNKITKKYFKYIKKIKLNNKNVDFTRHRKTDENIYIFIKN